MLQVADAAAPAATLPHPLPGPRARVRWGPREMAGSAAVRGLLGMAVLVGLLELASRSAFVNPAYLPPPTTMLRTLGEQAATSEFWRAFGATVRGWLLGLAVAMVAGVAAGIVIGGSPFLRRATASTEAFLRPIPSVGLIPVVVLMYGTSMTSTLILVIYSSFWPVLVQVMYGVQDVDPVARETARSFQFRRWTVVRTVVWPTTLPYVMTAFRLAAAVALILEVTGELIIGTPGLGKEIVVAQSSGAVEIVYALVVVTGVVGVVVNVGARAVERRVMRWHPSVRARTAA